jgi:atypical protein kinase C iota type
MEPTLLQNLPSTPTSTSANVGKKMVIYENIDAYNKLIQQQHHKHNSSTQSSYRSSFRSLSNKLGESTNNTSNYENLIIDEPSPTKKRQQNDDIKIQLFYCGTIMVIYINESINLDQFYNLIRLICKFDAKQLFTIKWVDEEGDPCTISSQVELDESIRLYYLNKESELIIHVFANMPEKPGTQCAGEDRSIYRRGARRWRKIYLVNGHKYQAKRFARNALCKVCMDRIWGLGRQGYKCLDCKIMVHKRCHKFINLKCEEILEQQLNMSSKSTNNTTINSNGHQFNTSSPMPTTNTAVVPPLPSILPSQLKPQYITQQQQCIEDLKNKLKSKQQCNELNVDTAIEAANKPQQTNGGQLSKINLDKFDLIKVIGRGSYAKVFLVEYKLTRKCYAMKVIKKSTFNDDEDIDWVQTEKHVFEQATNHPFLVGLHSCFQTESRLFFIIEYLCGGDLMYHMQQKRKLPEDHARFYSSEIILALDFLHSKGIIYRDLKLDNVLLDIEGHIKLTDYGMCKEGLTKGEKTSTFCGTPNYIAPEMLRGEEYDFSVDWWALGVLMYEMMAGRSPFEPVNENPSENPDLHTEDHLFQVILEKPIRIPRNLSVRAASVLKAFLQKQPEDRLGSNDGLREIQQHLFFKQIDWSALEQKLIQPPFKPPVQSERDLNNIDKLFTNEPVLFTPDSSINLDRIQQNEFEGFEYINPLIMTDEIPV